MGNGNSRAVHELELVASEIALQQVLVVLVKEAIWSPKAKRKIGLGEFQIAAGRSMARKKRYTFLHSYVYETFRFMHVRSNDQRHPRKPLVFCLCLS